MAIVAVFAADNMRGVLTGRQRAVVTRQTAAEHLRVVDLINRRPQYIAVAVVTDIGR